MKYLLGAVLYHQPELSVAAQPMNPTPLSLKNFFTMPLKGPGSRRRLALGLPSTSWLSRNKKDRPHSIFAHREEAQSCSASPKGTDKTAPGNRAHWRRMGSSDPENQVCFTMP